MPHSLINALTVDGSGVYGLEEMGQLSIVDRPHVRCIGLECIPGSLIRSLVIPYHGHAIIGTKHFRHGNVESIKVHREIHEHISHNRFRSYVNAIVFYKRHALALAPFNGRVKKCQYATYIASCEMGIGLLDYIYICHDMGLKVSKKGKDSRNNGKLIAHLHRMNDIAVLTNCPITGLPSNNIMTPPCIFRPMTSFRCIR